jgi:hypothetical protein
LEDTVKCILTALLLLAACGGTSDEGVVEITVALAGGDAGSVANSGASDAGPGGSGGSAKGGTYYRSNVSIVQAD